MTKSELFKKAHKLTKQVIQAGDDYRITFGLALKTIIADSKGALPALSGSEKQVAWANDIRSEFAVSALNHFLNTSRNNHHLARSQADVKVFEKIESVISAILSSPEAKAWIEKRAMIAKLKTVYDNISWQQKYAKDEVMAIDRQLIAAAKILKENNLLNFN